MWKSKLKLSADESLCHDRSFSKGCLGEEDISLYSVVNQEGTITGSVKYTDHTAIRGFRRTIHVIQKDRTENVIVDECWTE